jgi:hypothetical protein
MHTPERIHAACRSLTAEKYMLDKSLINLSFHEGYKLIISTSTS